MPTLIGNIRTHRRSNRQNRRRAGGQSLVEFILVSPFLILLMVAGVSMALGIYQAYLISDAVQQPTLQKLVYAGNDGAVDIGTLQTAMNGGLKTNLSKAAMVDSVQVVDSDPYTTVMLATKNFTPTVPLIPSFRFRVGQIINRNLLQAANAGGAVAHPVTAWVPGNTPVKPPWE